jgi:hypothetical protein
VGSVFVGTSGTSARAVAISRGYAYVTYDDYGIDGGLFVADVSTPSAPLRVGFYETARNATSVAASDGYVFVTTDGAGWYIFRECWLLFEDGFESGDTSAWSASVP